MHDANVAEIDCAPVCVVCWDDALATIVADRGHRDANVDDVDDADADDDSIVVVVVVVVVIVVVRQMVMRDWMIWRHRGAIDDATPTRLERWYRHQIVVVVVVGDDAMMVVIVVEVCCWCTADVDVDILATYDPKFRFVVFEKKKTISNTYLILHLLHKYNNKLDDNCVYLILLKAQT
jgi:hypothetical protein